MTDGKAPRWSRSERYARVANGFEKPGRGGPIDGGPIYVTMHAQGAPFNPQAVQEAYELGRRGHRR